MAGEFRCCGHQIATGGRSPWAAALPDGCAGRALHGFAWLDHLIAVGEPAAKENAALWIDEWILRYANGAGPGWTAQLAGRRLIRWAAYAGLLTRSFSPPAKARFHKTLEQHTNYLWARWRSAPAGTARVEALTGLVHGLTEVGGLPARFSAAGEALGHEAQEMLLAGATIGSRNPEELGDILALFTWSAVLLREAGAELAPAHVDVMEALAGVLRGLRHVNGDLARFHGGGPGVDGRLDQALRDAGGRRPAGEGRCMGFARIASGQCSVIADTARPPVGAHGALSHASTLAFEMTDGRQSVVVNCGPGQVFGPDWLRAARATSAQSTLELAGRSSAKLSTAGGAEILCGGAGDVPWDITRTPDVRRIEAGHDSWREEFGLTHARTMDLHAGGRLLVGEDILTTLSPGDETVFDRALQDAGADGFPFAVRFHLHPDITATLGGEDGVVTLKLPRQPDWTFRAEGPARVSVEPSYYLCAESAEPSTCSQVVLTGAVLSYASRVRWAFTKSPAASATDTGDPTPSDESSYD